jgi:signal transduction histidine kinase
MRLTSLPVRLADRRPVRLRLTLVYSSLFVLAGMVLLSVTYVLVAGTLTAKVAASGSAQASASTTAAASADPRPSAPAAPQGFGDPSSTARPAASGTAIAKTTPPPGYAGMDLAELCKKGLATPEQVNKCKYLAETAYDSGVAAARTNALDHLLYISLGALGLSAALSALLGWIVAGRALRPVHAITAAARRASDENLGERIALAGPPDELKDLADTFDAMLARLDAAFASQRRFVANASHELRTPLTVMRTAIEVTLAKPDRSPEQLEAMAAEVHQAAGRAEALIEALLTLARSDRGPGIQSPLDLAVLAEDALDAAAAPITAAALRVSSRLEPGLAAGDRVLVERLVGNLIDNAVRHNVPEGWIDVSTGSHDGMALIRVANSGPLIEEAAVESLFEPFRRLKPACAGQGAGASPPPGAARPVSAAWPVAQPDGVGLGLSIVRSVAAAHNGHVTARPGASGGLEITVVLPLGLDVLRYLAQEVGDLLGLLGIGVLAPPVGVGQPVKELYQVFHDRD